MRILDISRDFTIKGDGGSVVTRRNFNLLNEVGKVKSLFVPVPDLKTRLLNITLRQSYGETPKLKRQLDESLNEKFDLIFFDGSIYGEWLKRVADRGLKTMCFFHNVEKVYYEAKANHSGSIADKLMVSYIVHNERLSVIHSTYIVALNKRDSDDLFRIYGRKADLLLPSSFPSANVTGRDNGAEPYLLFVGTNFFANVEGVKFIIDHIAPLTEMNIKIVGNVNDSFREVQVPENLEFLGQVDDISEYYRNTLAVIAPIFSGSGLKTKTVEALRYGKTILGTPEAFEGIDIASNPEIGTVCSTSADFSAAISALPSSDGINPASLSLSPPPSPTKPPLATLKSFLSAQGL